MSTLVTSLFVTLGMITSFGKGLKSETQTRELASSKPKQTQEVETKKKKTLKKAHDHEDKHEEKEANHDEHGDHDSESKHEDHDKEENSQHNDHAEDEVNGEHKEHDEHAEEGEHGEENVQVGPNKGIVEANKENGFKLSAEAEKNFSIQRVKVLTTSSVQIPRNAIVTSGIETNLFRVRNGFYKRIDFVKISSVDNAITIRSDDLKINDEIAISGLGFLRISEIAAFDGAPSGHSH